MNHKVYLDDDIWTALKGDKSHAEQAREILRAHLGIHDKNDPITITVFGRKPDYSTIAAILALRTVSGIGLREAKDAVEGTRTTFEPLMAWSTGYQERPSSKSFEDSCALLEAHGVLFTVL